MALRRILRLALAVGLLATAAHAGNRASSEQVRFGISVAKKGLWAEARFRFERASALDKENAAALNNLAIAYEQLGEFGKAREAYEQALKIKPRDQMIRQNFDLFREADDKRNRKKKTTVTTSQ